MVRLARALGCGQPNLCVMSHTPRPARSASHRGPCEQSPLNARSLKRPVSRCHTRSRALRQRVGPVGVRLRDELPTQKALWRQRNRRPLRVVQGCPGPSRNQQGLAPNRASSPGSRQRFGSGTRRRRSPASRSRTVTRDVLQPSRRRPRAPHRQGTVHDRRRRSTGAPIVASRASTASIPSEHLRTRTVGVSLRTRVADASALSPSRSAVRCCSRVDAAGMTDPGQTSFPPPPLGNRAPPYKRICGRRHGRNKVRAASAPPSHRTRTGMRTSWSQKDADEVMSRRLRRVSIPRAQRCSELLRVFGDQVAGAARGDRRVLRRAPRRRRGVPGGDRHQSWLNAEGTRLRISI